MVGVEFKRDKFVKDAGKALRASQLIKGKEEAAKHFRNHPPRLSMIL